jgi:hypothetical protein
MPTGYTMELDGGNLTTAQWIKEHLARAFGVCVMFRDDGHMTEDGIKSALEKETLNNYHVKEYIKATSLLDKYTNHTSTKDWIRMMNQENAEIRKNNNESIKKAKAKQKLHAQVEKDLKVIMNYSEFETSRNIAKFGLDQLKAVEDECEPYHTNEWKSWKSFKDDKLKGVMRDVDYHEKESKVEHEREVGRLQAYKDLCDDVDAILGAK